MTKYQKYAILFYSLMFHSTVQGERKMDKNGVGLGKLPNIRPVVKSPKVQMSGFHSQDSPTLVGNRCTRCGQATDECGICTCFDHSRRVNMR